MDVARPPRSWEAQTVAVLVAIAAAALIAVLLLVRDLTLISTEGPAGLSEVSSLAFLLVLFAYVYGFAYWRRRTQAMLASVGITDGPVQVHWTIVAWNLAVGFGLVLRLGVRSSDRTTNLSVNAAVEGIRLLGLACLLYGVWQIRREVYRRIAEKGVQLRFDRIAAGPRESAVPVRTLLPEIASEDVEVADDEYWSTVSRTAAGLREQLALLESTGPLAHRWLLIPADGDVTAVRAELAPAALITAFTEPPAATETKDYTPLPADSYHGLIEDASGTLTYQSVSPKRVPAFLSRARTARRWALYPATRTALTAVVAG